ncbi:AAA family ATPase [Gilvimarinus agarilyticus]|uniref:AAA family ATPase n=1 Tax=Gilvimarinus sp. 2_MG-2023 TaxID=3062666 RepID=UPI001C0A45C1|nr:AAA family ATPase [Gilvimarinus sp. 2_MG-2023]MBU2887714.1 AAA family ATPase [Gilvimarinus agarilyticus]MDO6572361.1 AAA family ATPase [Gilvimarinus sp. 2_MG-2023]
MSSVSEQLTYVESNLRKLNESISVGQGMMRQIAQLVKESQGDKHDIATLKEHLVDDRVQKRRYGSTVAAEMASISHPRLYAAEKDGRLPPPDYRQDTKTKVRAGYTINQINYMRDVFNTAPRKPEGAAAAVIGILNLKGGSQKTTSCHLFSQYLAIQGYKVLLVDSDPQGSLSFFYGKRPDDNVQYEHTIAPFMLEDDEALVEAGWAPGASQTLDYAIQKTYWSNIDIIPACLQNLGIDQLMPEVLARSNIGYTDRFMKLRHGLIEASQDYDFIIIDGTPSLNLSTLNVISACDMVFVPAPASMPDFASTLQFTDLVAQTLEGHLERGEAPNIPDIRYFITKYSGSSYAQFMSDIIRKVFNVERGDVLINEVHSSDEVGKATNRTYSVYEQNSKDSDNPKRLKKTVEMFDSIFREMHDAIWDTVWGMQPRSDHMAQLDELFQKNAKIKKNLEQVTESSREEGGNE